MMKLTYIFAMLKNMYEYGIQYGMNSIHNLSLRPHERIRMHQWLFLEIIEDSFHVILWIF